MFDPGMIAVMIPIVALMIPIVAILTAHQRKMAEIVHSGANNPSSSYELAALRNEVAELRQLVHQQTLAMDSITTLARSQIDLGARLGGQTEA